MALNVDGLAHKRKKWDWIARKYYLMAERLATILPTETVTDAKVIQEYDPRVIAPFNHDCLWRRGRAPA